METEIRKCLEYLAIAKDAADLGIHDFDVVSGTAECDERVRAIWGVEPDELFTFEMFISRLHPDDRDSVQTAVDQALDPKGNGNYSAEFRVINTRDGVARWIAATGRVFFEDGRAVRLLGTAQDITERKRVEEFLWQSQTRLVEAQRLAKVGDWEWDHNRDRVIWSPGTYDVFGRSRELPPPDREGLSQYYTPESWTRLERSIHRALETGEPYEIELEHVREDGVRRWHLAHGEVVRDNAGQTVKLRGTAQDITERRRTEQKTIRQARVLDGFNRILQEAMSVDTEENLGKVCLAVAEKITGSKFGFLGEIKAGLLDDVAVSNPGWEACSLAPGSGHQKLPSGLEVHGIYGRVLLDGKSLFTNAPSNHPDSVGVPPGHPALTSFLGVPLIRDGRPIGIIAVGNRPDGYGNEQLEDLEAVAPAIVQAFSRKRAEEALRASEERFRVMFEGHGAAMLLIEPQTGKILDANKAASNFYGYSREQLRSMHIEEINQLPREEVEAERRRAVELGKNQFIFPHRLANSEIRWVEVHSSPVIIQNRPMLFSIIHDITARHQAEEALRRLNNELEHRVADRTAELEGAHKKAHSERQRFLDVLETLPVIVMLFRPDYRVEWVNRAYREALGNNVGLLCYVGQFGRDKPCEECQALLPLKTGQPRHWEWTIPNGRTFEVHNFPFADSDGSPMILEMDLDVTERRQAEKELQQAHEEMEALAFQLRALAGELTLTEQRERQRIAKVLHDHIQQMLAAAKLQTSVLANRQQTDELKASARLVSELIDQSILASRNLTAELSPPVLYDAGLGPALLWLARNFLDKHGLKVDVTFDPSGEPRVEDVRIFLFDAIREILFNVVKHSGSDKAFIECFRGRDDRVHVIVTDDGKGFDPSRIQNGERPHGFGLFSIQQRLRHLGGSVDIDSNPGKGTRITLISPLVSMAQQLSLVERHGSLPVAPVQESITGKTRVILADDHHIIRQGLAGLLRLEKDIEVIGEASNGVQVINLARSLQPDVVVMDVSMPVLNGIEATTEIHRDMPEIKVIGLSMHEEGELSSAIRQAGAVAYVTKGGAPEALVKAIRKAAGKEP